jgi:hypothetical protein
LTWNDPDSVIPLWLPCSVNVQVFGYFFPRLNDAKIEPLRGAVLDFNVLETDLNPLDFGHLNLAETVSPGLNTSPVTYVTVERSL